MTKETLLTGELDAGFWFDLLAILNSKIARSVGPIRGRAINQFERISNSIKKQIGEYKFNLIIDSPEYVELYEENLRVFDLIEMAKRDTGLARETDNANYSRFLLKSALQKKYFETDLTEIKLGY